MFTVVVDPDDVGLGPSTWKKGGKNGVIRTFCEASGLL
jgi:hypothetical protein